MKYIFLLILFLLSNQVWADCICEGYAILPKGNIISKNPIFIFSTCETNKEIILGIGQKYKVYLLADGNRQINLKVSETYFGQDGSIQITLMPEYPLTMGNEYYFCLDDIRSTEQEQYDYIFQSKPYKVKENISFSENYNIKEIKEKKKIFSIYGCGSDEYIIFNNPIENKIDIVVKTTVKDLSTGKQITFYIVPNGNEIKVGHHMCGGPFYFTKGEKYEVNFSFIDLVRNENMFSSKSIKFTPPKKETRF